MSGTLETIVILVSICVLCRGSDSRSGWPGYKYHSGVQGWMKVHETPTNWSTARANCHSEDALLASPWGPEFRSTIQDIQDKKLIPELHSGIGLRAGSPGIPLEPCGHKRCPVFVSGSTQSQKANCKRHLPYICYAPAPTSGHGYIYKAETGSSYKIHNTYKVISDARKVCQDEGGYLAKNNSQTELQILFGFVVDHDIYLTYIDNDDHGSSNPKHRHLVGSNPPYYDDYTCENSHPFICEKSGSVALMPSDLRD